MLVSETYQTNLIYCMVAIIYLALSLVLARLSHQAELRLQRGGGK
jgi:ABC-type arginine/histidine transport system permease subunit